MPRLVLSAMAVAGMLATTLQAFVDPLPATAADHARVAAATVAPAPPARLSPSAAPESDGHAEIIPVGPGWG
jgi:hypothetical protein